jgi:hypothetical protein
MTTPQAGPPPCRRVRSAGARLDLDYTLNLNSTGFRHGEPSAPTLPHPKGRRAGSASAVSSARRAVRQVCGASPRARSDGATCRSGIRRCVTACRSWRATTTGFVPDVRHDASPDPCRSRRPKHTRPREGLALRGSARERAGPCRASRGALASPVLPQLTVDSATSPAAVRRSRHTVSTSPRPEPTRIEAAVLSRS